MTQQAKPSGTISSEKRPRVYSVEFWRFAFTILVTLYHLEIFFQRKIMPSGTTAVEFFFILAGFTIAMSAARKIENIETRQMSTRDAHRHALEFMKKKLSVIYPMLAVTLILAIVVLPLVTPPIPMFQPPVTDGLWTRFLQRLGALANSEWEWLAMVGTPMGFNNATSDSAPIVPLWFLTQLFIVGYMFSFLMSRKYDLMMFAAPLIAVLGYTFFVLNSENILDFYVKMGVFNAGTVRAISEMAMGVSLYQLYTYLSGRNWKLLGKILLQLLEIYAIYRFCVLTFFADLSIDNFRRIPYILIIILLSFANLTFLTKLLNRKFMEILGKISLPIFLIHFPLATLYVSVLFAVRRSPEARNLPQFILGAGGGGIRNSQLSVGDLLLYLPFVIIVSILMLCLHWGVRKLCARICNRNAEIGDQMQE